MSRTEIETALTNLNQLVTSGRLIEAFEKCYHDELVMQKNISWTSEVSKTSARITEQININQYGLLKNG